MKATRTGTVSGCLIWFILLFLLGSCIVPVAMLIGGFTSGTSLALRVVTPMVCPPDSTSKIHSYATTTQDENGFEQPAVGYELHCLDSKGKLVKTSQIGYSFFWIGITSIIGLMLSGILAFLLAAPAGAWIARFVKKRQAGQ